MVGCAILQHQKDGFVNPKKTLDGFTSLSTGFVDFATIHNIPSMSVYIWYIYIYMCIHMYIHTYIQLNIQLNIHILFIDHCPNLAADWNSSAMGSPGSSAPGLREGGGAAGGAGRSRPGEGGRGASCAGRLGVGCCDSWENGHVTGKES